MFLNFSITPLRISALLGVATSMVSLLLLVAIVVDKLYVNPNVTHGLPTVLVVVTLFAGVQLVILGTIGEYLGRLFLDHSSAPQFVVRYVRRGGRRSVSESWRGKRVLVTGGIGFIGSNLAIRLVELGARVQLVDSMLPAYGADLANIEPVRERLRVNFSDVRDRHSLG